MQFLAGWNTRSSPTVLLNTSAINYLLYTLQYSFYFVTTIWNDVTVSKAVLTVPGTLAHQPIFPSIDDTMFEKYGKHFEMGNFKSCKLVYLIL